MDFKEEIDNKIKQLKGVSWVNILDKSITMDEIKTAIKELKGKKACSLDSVSNDMIKCGVEIMSSVLLKLFNHVLHSVIFPAAWAEDYINALFKKGDCLDPSNYRGITVSSCIGKPFTKILKTRFTQLLVEHNIINVSQIGSSPGKRTTDHIFVHKTLLDQAKNSKNHLYMCFIDLESSFDTVWRNGL